MNCRLKNALSAIVMQIAIIVICIMSAPVFSFAAQYKADEVLIKFKDTASQRAFKDIKNDYNASPLRRFKINNVYEYRLPSDMTPAKAKRIISKNPNIEFIEPNYKIAVNKVPNDPYYNNQYGMQLIQMPSAWDIMTGDKSIATAVIDTGVDYNHEDIAQNIWTNADEIPDNGIDDDNNGYIDDVRGWNFYDNTNDPIDVHTHGTFMAGIIGALGDNNKGIAGVAWQSSIMSIRFTDRSGSGYISNAIQAIQYAVNNGAKIINASWSGYGYSESLYRAIEYANSKDVLFVTSAGNGSTNIDESPVYPACFNLANIITVTSVDQSNELASFANFGVNSVDITAPGVNIISTVPNNDYAYNSGASTSVPFVAGVCALLMSKYPESTSLEIKERLFAGADKIDLLNEKVAGSRRLNAHSALNIPAEQVPSPDKVYVKGGKFYSDPEAKSEITTVTIKAGTSSVSFYYLDDQVGTPTITAKDANGQNIESISQDIAIVESLTEDIVKSVSEIFSRLASETEGAAKIIEDSLKSLSKEALELVASGDTAKLATIFSQDVPDLSINYAVTWSQRNIPTKSLSNKSIACSTDGSFVVISGASQGTFTSSDAGVSWTTRTAPVSATDVACNYNGTILYATVSGSNIQKSTDYGASWTSLSGSVSGTWMTIACSSNGQYVVAGTTSGTTGNLYVSSNSGTDWTMISSMGVKSWYGTAVSSDGSKMVACAYNGYIYTSTNYGVTWTERQPVASTPKLWYNVSISGDGSTMAACGASTNIYVSTNDGASWTARETSRNWFGIRISNDGTKMAATVLTNVGGGYIYTSTNQGANWTERSIAGLRDWREICTSDDGTKLIAVVNGDFPFKSTDSGASWTPVCPYSSTSSGTWTDVASSSDGTKLAACAGGASDNYIFYSANSGATWVPFANAGLRKWSGISMSSDGSKFAACMNGSSGNRYIYTSTDSGSTWVERTGAGSYPWSGIACSSDGTKLAACVYGGYVYTSSDSGASWTQRNSSRNWQRITLSADGTKGVACVYGGYIYTSTDSGANWTERQPYTGTVKNWSDVAISNDGQKILAANYTSSAYLSLSTDGGATWANNKANTYAWRCAAMSSDGTRMIAGAVNSYLYFCVNSGTTWTSQNPVALNCLATSMSSDGTKIIAALSDGIYTGSENIPVPPTLTTTSVSSITTTTAASGGNITSDGGDAVTARGVCWSTSPSPTTANSKTTNGSGTGSFSSSLTGLTPGATYYVRAYATNNFGTSYGNELSFSSLAATPTLTTTVVSLGRMTTALSGGNITSDGGASVTARGVCWNTSSSPTISNSKTTDGPGTGSFASTITGLTPGTLYYVRAYATNSAGTSYGSNQSFTATYFWQSQGYLQSGGSNISLGSSTNTSAAFADLDNDGKLDMLAYGYGDGSGNSARVYYYYKNTGSSSDPTFVLYTSTYAQANGYPIFTDMYGKLLYDNITPIIDGASNSSWYFGSPVFADLDNDGDFDLVLGACYFKNIGTKTYPVFSPQKSISELTDNDGRFIDKLNPTNVIEGYYGLSFYDFDNDGLLDLFCGNSSYYILCYRNIGTKTDPRWTLYTSDYATANSKPIFTNSSGQVINNSGTAISCSYGSYPSIVDLDNDGDFDLAIGETYGYVYYYKNTGSNASPSLTLQLSSSGLTDTSGRFIGVSCGNYSKPTFADINNDGGVDLLLGMYNGYIGYYKNMFDLSAGPSSPNVTINSGAGTTTSTTINLDLTTAGAVKMKVSNYLVSGYTDEINTNSGKWIDCTSPITWELPQGLHYGDVCSIYAWLLDSNGFASGFNTASIIYNNGAPRMPLSASVSYSAVGNKMVIAWGDVTGETGYTIERSINGSSWSVIANLSADVTSYEDSDSIDIRNNYSYRIKAINDNGSSEYASVSEPLNISWQIGITEGSWLNSGFLYDSSGTVISAYSNTDVMISKFADFDNDGDLDLILEAEYSYGASPYLKYYRNIGTSISPSYVLYTSTYAQSNGLPVFTNSSGYIIDFEGSIIGAPVNGVNYAILSITDIDNDGDLDLIFGNTYSRNAGSNSIPQFCPITSFTSVTGYINTFGDLDNDGKIDMIMDGKLYKNTTNEAGLSFTLQQNITNFTDTNGSVIDDQSTAINSSRCTLVDIDKDAKLDLVTVPYNSFYFYKNIGTVSQPILRLQKNIDGLTDSLGRFVDYQKVPIDTVYAQQVGGYYPWPYFVDIDNDGDLDIVTGVRLNQSRIIVIKNISDNSGPASPSILIKNIDDEDIVETDTYSIKLSLGALTASYMKISNYLVSPSCDNILQQGVWEAYSTSRAWQLPSMHYGEVAKVTVNYADSLGRPCGRVTDTVIVNTGTPLEPRNYSATYDTENKKNVLSWSDTTGEISYRIERSIDQGPFVAIATLDANIISYDDTDIKGMRYYKYKLIATNSAGDSDPIYKVINFTRTKWDQNYTSTPVSGYSWVSGSILKDDSPTPASIAGVAPVFADLDNDGDLDLAVGNGTGNIYYYRNTGTALSPKWTLYTSTYATANGLPVFTDTTGKFVDNTSTTITKGTLCYPKFADLDNDGDLDLTLAASSSIYYYLNTGTNTAPVWRLYTSTYANANGLPVFTDLNGKFVNSSSSVISYSYISHYFGDLDNDGDLDLLVSGGMYGKLIYYLNTGTKTAPVWTLYTSTYSNSNNIPVFTDTSGNIVDRSGNAIIRSAYSSGQIYPALCDLDNDGDLDLIVAGDYGGGELYYKNVGSISTPSWQLFTSINEINTSQILVGTGGNFYGNTSGGYGNLYLGNVPILCFADLDNDGNVDMIYGNGNIGFVKNTATNTGYPSSPSISINNADETTSSKTVTLSISATSADYMKISNYLVSSAGETIYANSGRWETYGTSRSWQLPGNIPDGAVLNVYASFCTKLGLQSPYIYDSIAYQAPGTTEPTVSTTSASSVTGTTASSGGNVTSDGGATVTARGVCWSTNPNPTTALATKTSDGTGTGSFTSSISGLTSSTLYYVRAYATNIAGTSYGDQVSFTTSDVTPPTVESVSPLADATNVPVATTITVTFNESMNPSTINTSTFLVYAGTQLIEGTVSYESNTATFTPSSNLNSNTTYTPNISTSVTDANGNALGSLYYWNFTTVDTEPPSDGTISINGGAEYTGSRDVTLTVNSEGASEMMISENIDFSGAVWESYQETKEFTLSAGTAIKRVNIKFKDAAGNVSLNPVCDTIILDVTPPEIELTTPTNGAVDFPVHNTVIKARFNEPMDATSITTSTFKVFQGETEISGIVTYSQGLPYEASFDKQSLWGFNKTYTAILYTGIKDSNGNNLDTQYSWTFTTVTASPTVITSGISGITNTSVSFSGNVTDDGGSEVTARGACYSTSPTPTVDDYKTDGSGTGAFTSSVTGLTPGTLYYIRAYATNIAGTGYGEERSFTTLNVPTVTTTEVSDVTASGATSGGNVTSDGGAAVTARGVCWSLAENPTISDSYTTDGTGTDSFTSSITELTSETTYHLRAYASNSVGTAYGSDLMFTTLDITPPIVSVYSPSDGASAVPLTESLQITFNENVSKVAGKKIRIMDYLIETLVEEIDADSAVISSNIVTIDPVNNLSSLTHYYITVQAGAFLDASSNESGAIGMTNKTDWDFTAVDSESPYSTLLTPSNNSIEIAYINTVLAVNFSENIVKGSGNILIKKYSDDTTIKSINVTDDSITINNNTATINLNTVLQSGVKYYVLIDSGVFQDATGNDYVGISSKNDWIFTTIFTTATQQIVSISDTTAVAGGIISNTDDVISARGICWSTSENPTISLEAKTSDIAVDGIFTSNITGLNPNTTYHVRAYATNNNGTTKYGDDISFTTLPAPVDFSWYEKKVSGENRWAVIASSSDGIKLAACDYNGYIYTSNNSGVTWTEQANSGTRAWSSITSSADGSKLAACVNGGYVYISNDFGSTWVPQTNLGNKSWMSIASSSDGSKLAACVSGGYIYTSSDYGVNWIERTEIQSGVPWTTKNWYSITSSADGSKLVACVNGGYIYTSTDYGATWTERQPVVGVAKSWRSVASSSTGQKLVACAVGGYIYTSTNYGVAWTGQSSSGDRSWRSVTTSSDGSKLAACVGSGYIYTSTDSGATWTVQNGSGNRAWRSIVSNSDGSILTACVDYGYIYSSTDYGLTWTQRNNFGTRKWESLVFLSDWNTLVAGYTGYIYKSTDSGFTWSGQQLLYAGGSVASASDGLKLAACGTGATSYIFTSDNSGATWTQRTSAGKRNWWAIASDSTGEKLSACVYINGNIYTSTDGGNSWTAQAGPGSRDWSGIASSSDGTKLAACVGRYSGTSGYIWTGVYSNGEWTWTEQQGSGSRTWYSIISSTDGTKLAACANNGYIYTSTDSGVTWVPQTNAGSRSWTSISASSDWIKLAACVYGGYIYTSNDSGATWTEQTDAGSRDWNVILLSSDGTEIAAGVGQYSQGCLYAGTRVTPLVTTTSASLITTTTASLGGNVTYNGPNGASEVTEYGVCWGTSEYPVIDDNPNTTTNGAGTDTFTNNLTELSPNTTYYVRAYATNAYGTAYGPQVSFTTEALDVTAPAPGNSGVIEYSEQGLNSIKLTWTKATDSKTTQANLLYKVVQSQDGTNIDTVEDDVENPDVTVVQGWTADIHTVTATGLASDSCYWFNVFVKDAVGNKSAYTASYSYTTDTLGPIPGNSGTITFANQTSNSVDVNWTIAMDNLTPQSDIQYKVVKSMLNNISTVTDAEVNGSIVKDWTDNIYTATATSLVQGRVYFNIITKDLTGNKSIYTVNSIVIPDTTNPIPGNGGTITAGTVTGTSLILNWVKAADNVSIPANLQYKVVSSLANNIDTSTKAEQNGDLIQGWTSDINTCNVSGLSTNTTYYFNIIVKDEAGNKAAYVCIDQTTLPPDLPTVTTTTASSVATTTALSGGNVTSNGGEILTARGVCWSISENPTISNSHTSDGTDTGVFTSSIEGLSPSTLYYVRAYATNSTGTAYGDQISFTTADLPISSPVITAPNGQSKVKDNDVITVSGSISVSGCTIVSKKVLDHENSEISGIDLGNIQLQGAVLSGSFNIGTITTSDIKLEIIVKDDEDNQSLSGNSRSSVLLVDNIPPSVNVTYLGYGSSGLPLKVNMRNLYFNIQGVRDSGGIQIRFPTNGNNPNSGLYAAHFVTNQQDTGIEPITLNTWTTIPVDKLLRLYLTTTDSSKPVCIEVRDAAYNIASLSGSILYEVKTDSFSFNIRDSITQNFVSGNTINHRSVELVVDRAATHTYYKVYGNVVTPDSTNPNEGWHQFSQLSDSRIIPKLLSLGNGLKTITMEVRTDAWNKPPSQNRSVAFNKTPVVNIKTYPSVLSSGTGNIVWRTNITGTYQVRVNPTVIGGVPDKTTGTLITGSNAQGSCIDDIDTCITSVINYSDLSLSFNKVYVFVTANNVTNYSVCNIQTSTDPILLADETSNPTVPQPTKFFITIPNSYRITNNPTSFELDFDDDGHYDAKYPIELLNNLQYMNAGILYKYHYPLSEVQPKLKIINGNGTSQVFGLKQYPQGGGLLQDRTLTIAQGYAPSLSVTARTPSIDATPDNFRSDVSGYAPLKVMFRPVATYGGTPVHTFASCEFDFDGCGHPEYTEDKQLGDIVYIYHKPGVYTAKVKVLDEWSFVGKDEVTITVLEPPGTPTVIAGITGNTSGQVPFTVALTGSATDIDGSILFYEWDFEGDGTYDWISTPEAENADTSYVYREVGIYTPTLRVTDNNGISNISSVAITATRNSNLNSPVLPAPTDMQCNLGAPLNIYLGALSNIEKINIDLDHDGIWDLIKGPGEVFTIDTDKTGYNSMLIQAVGTNGLASTSTCFILVKTDNACTSGVNCAVMNPTNNMNIYGSVANAKVPIRGIVMPYGAANIAEFQYTTYDDSTWSLEPTVIPVTSLTPYINAIWDTSALSSDTYYRLRLKITTATGSVYYSTDQGSGGDITVKISSTATYKYEQDLTTDKPIVQNTYDFTQKEQQYLNDGTKAILYPGAYSGTAMFKITELTNAQCGNATNTNLMKKRDFTLSGVSEVQAKLNKYITVTLPYDDVNDDNIVDDTSTYEWDLYVYYYDGTQWQKLQTPYYIDCETNTITCQINCLQEVSLD